MSSKQSKCVGERARAHSLCVADWHVFVHFDVIEAMVIASPMHVYFTFFGSLFPIAFRCAALPIVNFDSRAL